MAQTEDIEIIRIDTGEAVNNLKELNQYIKDLKGSMNEAKMGSDEFVQAQNELDKAVLSQKQIMNGALNEYKAAKGSFNDLSNQLRELKEAWKATGDEAERNRLTEEVNKVKAQLNEMNHSIGNFQDNVGNYAGALAPYFKNLEDKLGGVQDTLGSMGMSISGLTNPIKAVNSAFKLLSTNPIIGVITLLVGLFIKVKDAVSQNEDLQRRWNKALAAFEPIGNLVAKIFDKLAEGLVWIVEQASKLFEWFSDAAEVTVDLAEATDELNERKKKFISKEKELKAEAAQMKALGKETKDLNEALKLYTDARAKNKEANQEALEIAQEELRILQEKAKLTPNSEEDNKRLAEAEAKVYDIQKKLNDEDREYIELINTTNNSIKSLGSSSVSTADKLKKLNEEVEKMEKTIKDSSQTQVQKLEKEKQKWIEIYKQVGKNTKALEEYYNKQITAEEQKQKEQEKKTNQQNISSFNDVTKSISQLVGIDTQGTDLADQWLALLDKDKIVKEALGSSSSSSSEINKAYTDYIMSDLFPRKKDIMPYTMKWVSAITESITDSTTYDEIRKGLAELSKGVKRDFGDKGGFLDILPEGTIAFNSFFNEDGIKEAKQQFLDTFAQLKEAMGAENPDNDLIQNLRAQLNYHVAIIQKLQEEKDAYNIIIDSAVELNDKALNKSQGTINTERFFGTKTDENGWATDGTKLGKSLRNFTKVWQEYGNAVTTVLSTISDAWEENLQKQVEAGRMTEEEAREQFKMIKAMQYSMSLINAAASIVSIWADPTMENYGKIALTVSVAAQNAAELVQIATTQFGDMSSVSGSNTATINPAVINDTNPVNYTRNVTTAEERDALNNQPIYVSVTEIDRAQQGKKVKVSESRF